MTLLGSGSDLLDVHLSLAGRSFLMGNFNVVQNPDDRKGSCFYQSRAAAFNEFILAAGLTDMKLGGRKYTWIGMGGTKLSKLDRILISPDLLNDWPIVSVVALERTFADHCPLLLKSVQCDYGPPPFRFFDHWLQNDSFNEMVKVAWVNFKSSGRPMTVLKNKLRLLKF